MKNSKDKNIIRLILVFLVYYLANRYIPDLVPKYGKTINSLIKDIIIMIVVILIYYKDIKRDFNKFKRSDNKWILILWTAGIIFACYCISLFISKYFPSILKSVPEFGTPKYDNIFKLYPFFKAVIFTSIVETILYFLSFRKVFNNDVIFIIVSSLVYTYFNYVFGGFDLHFILNCLIIRFIPCALYTFAYIKNDNNIVSLMVILMIRNALAFFGIIVG